MGNVTCSNINLKLTKLILPSILTYFIEKRRKKENFLSTLYFLYGDSNAIVHIFSVVRRCLLSFLFPLEIINLYNTRRNKSRSSLDRSSNNKQDFSVGVSTSKIILLVVVCWIFPREKNGGSAEFKDLRESKSSSSFVSSDK